MSRQRQRQLILILIPLALSMVLGIIGMLIYILSSSQEYRDVAFNFRVVVLGVSAQAINSFMILFCSSILMMLSRSSSNAGMQYREGGCLSVYIKMCFIALMTVFAANVSSKLSMSSDSVFLFNASLFLFLMSIVQMVVMVIPSVTLAVRDLKEGKNG